jgi:hypothetical protein
MTGFTLKKKNPRKAFKGKGQDGKAEAVKSGPGFRGSPACPVFRGMRL